MCVNIQKNQTALELCWDYSNRKILQVFDVHIQIFFVHLWPHAQIIKYFHTSHRLHKSDVYRYCIRHSIVMSTVIETCENNHINPPSLVLFHLFGQDLYYLQLCQAMNSQLLPVTLKPRPRSASLTGVSGSPGSAELQSDSAPCSPSSPTTPGSTSSAVCPHTVNLIEHRAASPSSSVTANPLRHQIEAVGVEEGSGDGEVTECEVAAESVEVSDSAAS